MDLDLDALFSWLATAAILVAFARGVRAYREISRITQIDDTSLILQTIRDGTLIKVVAAGWFGAITAFGLLGFGPFPLLRPISVVLAILVLDLPSRYLVMIRTIRGEPVGVLGLPVTAWFRRIRWRR